jgi:hypothetical protein
LIKNTVLLIRNGLFLVKNRPVREKNRRFFMPKMTFLSKKSRQGGKNMANSGNWLPGTREAQLNMAQVWLTVIPIRGSGWSIPAPELQELTACVSNAAAILQTALSGDRTHTITTECQRLFGELVAKMRFIKDRYFKTPPLMDEDYTALLLKVPDTTRSPRGDPKAQMTAEIRRSGTNMLILAYRYAEGTEHLADPHTDVSRQVRSGLLPPPGITPVGTDLTKVPTTPEELPDVFDTKRKTDYIYFPPGSSGKTAYFEIRIHNGKSGYGPWCPMFSAVVP